MNLDRFFLVFAGIVVLISALLTWAASGWWLLLTVFIGVHLIQSAFTGFCPLAMVLKSLGMKPGEIFR
ncbi:conserved hypothetical protein [Thioalkalivibrio sp. K90mix]|jgi:hypothetical protein|uniref:YgaP family membrane protein n=1 Tax=Thioalkalivibrio sp. (strain K90mix) TaxID=396595 RepID=UPI000195A828|nr:DUF2892 domain-containing protein [Thioalkalivibrio sp. K90mix]ADC71509.1 conserved hypothetical protein [Thioalkalivibrio sp. K90mix]